MSIAMTLTANLRPIRAPFAKDSAIPLPDMRSAFISSSGALSSSSGHMSAANITAEGADMKLARTRSPEEMPMDDKRGIRAKEIVASEETSRIISERLLIFGT